MTQGRLYGQRRQLCLDRQMHACLVVPNNGQYHRSSLIEVEKSGPNKRVCIWSSQRHLASQQRVLCSWSSPGPDQSNWTERALCSIKRQPPAKPPETGNLINKERADGQRVLHVRFWNFALGTTLNNIQGFQFYIDTQFMASKVKGVDLFNTVSFHCYVDDHYFGFTSTWNVSNRW